MQRDASLLDPRTLVGASSGFARHVGRHDRGGEREGRSEADARRGRGLRGGAWVAMSDSDPRSRAGKQMPASDRPARILLWVLVSAPRKIGGGNASRAAPLFWGHAGIAWRTGGKYVVGKRSKKPGSAWRTRPRGEEIHPRAARRRRPARLLSVSGPDAITASTETFTAHIFSRARVATTSPSLRKPSRSATALRERPQADVHAVWSSAPTERCVVERAAVRTGKNS